MSSVVKELGYVAPMGEFLHDDFADTLPLRTEVHSSVEPSVSEASPETSAQYSGQLATKGANHSESLLAA